MRIRMIVTTLIASLVVAGHPVAAQQRAGRAPETCAKFAGANAAPAVRLTLMTGTELKGRVVGYAQPDSYVLCEVQVTRGTLSVPGSNDVAATIKRSELRAIDIVDGLRYKNADAIDTNLVRAVVELNGRERNIDIKTRDGRQMRGRITSTDDANFTVTGETSTPIAYGDVLEVRRAQLHWGWKAAMWSAGLTGATLLLVFLNIMANTH